MRRQLGPPIPREHTFVVVGAHAMNCLRGLEIAHIPDVLADDKRFFVGQLKLFGEKFRLVFFAEHFGRLRMVAGDRIRAKFGQDKRFGIQLVNQFDLFVQAFQPQIDLTGLRIPTAVAVQTDHIHELKRFFERSLMADQRHRAGRIKLAGQFRLCFEGCDGFGAAGMVDDGEIAVIGLRVLRLSRYAARSPATT